jgi:hypothetical protein
VSAESSATAPRTYGDLKRLIASTPRGDWPSRVNAAMTRSQALDVLGEAIKSYPDELRIADTIRGDLMTRNVLRECRGRGHD